MAIEKAVQIPLEVWQDPQGDVILNVSERGCHVFFGCWDEDSSPTEYVAKITFKGCWATKFIHTEYLPYEAEEYKHHSYILKVYDSVWLNELVAKKKEYYSNSYSSLDYSHYVVKGHDVYVEVIAKDFILERLSKEQAGEYARLIDEA